MTFFSYIIFKYYFKIDITIEIINKNKEIINVFILIFNNIFKFSIFINFDFFYLYSLKLVL